MNKKSIRLSMTALSIAAAGAGIPAWAQPAVQLSGLADGYVGSIRMAGDAASRTTMGSGGMTYLLVGVEGL